MFEIINSAEVLIRLVLNKCGSKKIIHLGYVILLYPMEIENVNKKYEKVANKMFYSAIYFITLLCYTLTFYKK